MSSQYLQSELLNLIQESKRKNTDLRHAAEESLNDLKALPSTSEAQISADLVRKPKFVDPFILACHGRHAKTAGIGVVCLQRLVASRSLPSERLKDVLGGLKETTNLSLDIQLKILQTLPSLFQHYSSDLSGELLGSTLEICATLQASKTLAVSSTAAATLQQLVVSTFERVSTEDNGSKSTVSVKVDGNSVDIGVLAYDALRVLDDLCRLVDGEPLQFLRIKSLSPTFTLELIESVLLNSGRLFVDHAELTQVLRTRLVPLTVRYLSERHSFAQSVRVSRILLVILKRHMSLLTADCEMALSLMTHLLEPDGTSPWKRVLCMEIFRGLYAEPGLVRLIYSLYDGVDGRKCILKDHMAALVRLASEKPAVIGVSNRSTMPAGAGHSRSMTEDQITLEASGLAGVIGTTVSSNDTNVPGISTQWSVVRTAYIELLDKTDPPPPPETYIYSLVLNCISAFAEGLAKFILPLTVPDLKQKRKNRIANSEQNGSPARPVQDLQRTDSSKSITKSSPKRSTIPLNPLELDSHPQFSAIKTCAAIIDNCWPAILAACSTFLYASLDDDFYHNLVRSFQKLAHVAGLLRLSTPRDAFLTTLGKSAMPVDTSGIKLAGGATTAKGASQHSYRGDEKRKGPESSVGSSVPADTAGASSDGPSLSLSTRNLLCLRALLNLGIALGSTLDQPAWSIVLGTLQDTDLLVGTSSVKPSAAGEAISGAEATKANIGAEVSAVQGASNKMFESTGDYPSDSFEEILSALLNLSGGSEETSPKKSSDKSPSGVGSAKRSGIRRDTRRVSLAIGKSRMQDEELKFVLEKANELAKANLERLSSLVEDESRAWSLLTDKLMSSAADETISQPLRLRANEALNSLVFETMKQREDDDESTQNARQMRNLQALSMQIKLLYDRSPCVPGSPSSSIAEVHQQVLEVLKAILEQYADAFSEGWTVVFEIISTVFGTTLPAGSEAPPCRKASKTTLLADSPRLIRVSYKSLQLIGSDFISLLPSPCRLDLVDSFSKFALQQQDFNISLTTTSSFWNVSDFLQGQIEEFSIESQVDASVTEEKLAKLAKNEESSVSRNALWLLLLLRIVDLTTDRRSEIRNCAVHTLLRIFDAYGQQLSPKAWRLCLNRVLFRMVEEVETELIEINDKGVDRSSEGLSSWVDTTVVMIKGASDLITTFFDPIIKDEEFDKSWKRLFEYFRKFISLHILEISEAVFTSVSKMLVRVDGPNGLSKQAVQVTWSLWMDGHPADREDLLDLEKPNQDAALAYLEAFQQVYRLYKNDLSGADIGKILGHMRFLAWNSILPRYSPDIDRPSDLQSLIIKCTKTLCTDKAESQADILHCLAEFADSALSKWTPGSDSRKPTFVAFSKSAIELLRWYIADFGIKQDIFSNGSLVTALEHLANPISQKYEWPGKDREPSLWQKSTVASLDVLQVAIPYVEQQYEKSQQSVVERFWDCVVHIADGIVSARGYRTVAIPRPNILNDESTDISAFSRLQTLIIPSLGAHTIPDSTRRDFACALLRPSFIYAPQRSDLPPKLINDPLTNLYDIRPGRTFDPAPTSRTRMAYTLIDSLFELSAAPGQDQQRVLLARDISPYLILRCAVALKSYIADQPLRGLMPQPTPARKALLHLLRGMVNLRSRPSTIPPLPAVKGKRSASVPVDDEDDEGSNSNKHLEWIYPLVVQAVQVAGKEKDDGEVLHALGKVLQEIGR
ncbi:putative endosomal peripheral membrane protein (Mon2) [Aspergillus candidus]|uniref:Endosomal peripheral membrane protein n=1 Tax=Aspergillus candidus TaxID=41067 RepID=A0A2I2FPD0_ASPCN|nr:hypothetical protein BDW47DRAFT_97271 [Aspergillus candidus]PLB42488.1 hypothetical protein BDW47DRAFT_97271 [Aspergillus candidus]